MVSAMASRQARRLKKLIGSLTRCDAVRWPTGTACGGSYPDFSSDETLASTASTSDRACTVTSPSNVTPT